MKPGGPVFDGRIASECRVRWGYSDEVPVKSFMRRHYLHKRPAVITACIVLERAGEAVGCAIFALPPRETEKRYGGSTWELARLFVVDEMPKNTETWFLARAISLVTSRHRDLVALVSYADPSVGHQGTIYRAAGWERDGRTDEGRRTPRADYVVREETLFGPVARRYQRRAHVPSVAVAERVPRVSKFRYVRRLRKARK